jgi:cell division protein FtsW (lipid II flippase)
MTEGSAPQYQGANGEDEVNAWGIGLLLFAALLMLLGGALQAFIGLVAMFSDQILIPTRRYLFEFDHTSWGWVHLVLGVVVAGAGAGRLAGRTWGRMVAIVLALCNAVVMFAFLPQYPAGALIIIAVSIAVIWAVMTTNR